MLWDFLLSISRKQSVKAIAYSLYQNKAGTGPEAIQNTIFHLLWSISRSYSHLVWLPTLPFSIYDNNNIIILFLFLCLLFWVFLFCFFVFVFVTTRKHGVVLTIRGAISIFIVLVRVRQRILYRLGSGIGLVSVLVLSVLVLRFTMRPVSSMCPFSCNSNK